jgi:hypothetical protein
MFTSTTARRHCGLCRSGGAAHNATIAALGVALHLNRRLRSQAIDDLKVLCNTSPDDALRSNNQGFVRTHNINHYTIFAALCVLAANFFCQFKAPFNSFANQVGCHLDANAVPP